MSAGSMSCLPGILVEQSGDVIGTETVVPIADVVANQDFAVFGENGFGVGTAQATDHVTDFFPVFRAVIDHRLSIIDPDATGCDFFVEQTTQQGFGIQLQEFLCFDRCCELGDAGPAVSVMLVGAGQFLQEEAGGSAWAGGGEQP